MNMENKTGSKLGSTKLGHEKEFKVDGVNCSVGMINRNIKNNVYLVCNTWMEVTADKEANLCDLDEKYTFDHSRFIRSLINRADKKLKELIRELLGPSKMVIVSDDLSEQIKVTSRGYARWECAIIFDRDVRMKDLEVIVELFIEWLKDYPGVRLHTSKHFRD